MTSRRLLKIGELERLSGVPRYTIHSYVRNGLLEKPVKTGKTMAYYNESHLERLKKIQEFKGSSRLPLSFLKKALSEGAEVTQDNSGRNRTQQTSEPRAEIREGRKRQIREAALKVFLQKGFQQARIQDITAKAGVSTGTFYIYYKTKRELFLDVVDEMTASTVKALNDGVKDDSDMLKSAIASTQRYMDNYPFFAGIINQFRGMMASGEPSAKRKFVDLYDKLASPIADQVRNAIKKGLMRDIDPELTASAIMGVVEFLSFRLTYDDTRTSGEAISFILDLFLNGLSPEAELHDGRALPITRA